jgi:tRNA (uracil-5-)-methyltransferase TRM9
LTRIASKHQPHSSVVADNIELPHPINTFDFAISIAVIHHFSTWERRVSAIRTLLDILRPPRGLGPFAPSPRISNRDPDGGRILIFVWALEQRQSRRGWDTGDDQDVLVPWVSETVKTPEPRQIVSKSSTPEYRKLDSVQLSKNDSESEQKLASSTMEKTKTTYQRFYHLFRRGELEECILEAGGKVLQSGYEKDNWWAIASRRPLAKQDG